MDSRTTIPGFPSLRVAEIPALCRSPVFSPTAPGCGSCPKRLGSVVVGHLGRSGPMALPRQSGGGCAASFRFFGGLGGWQALPSGLGSAPSARCQSRYPPIVMASFMADACPQSAPAPGLADRQGPLCSVFLLGLGSTPVRGASWLRPRAADQGLACGAAFGRGGPGVAQG